MCYKYNGCCEYSTLPPLLSQFLSSSWCRATWARSAGRVSGDWVAPVLVLLRLLLLLLLLLVLSW